MPTIPMDLSGLLGSSISGLTGPLGIASSNSKRRSIMTTETEASGGAGFVRAVSCAALGAGSKAFMEHYGVKYPMYT